MWSGGVGAGLAVEGLARWQAAALLIALECGKLFQSSGQAISEPNTHRDTHTVAHTNTPTRHTHTNSQFSFGRKAATKRQNSGKESVGEERQREGERGCLPMRQTKAR